MRRNGAGKRDGDLRGSVDRGLSTLATVGVAVVVAAVFGALGFGLVQAFGGGDEDPFGGGVDSSRFQTVVLSNDRVYFGRLVDRRGDFYLLTDVYFLREAPAEDGDEPVREVLPLSAELQGPENRMLIHEDHLVLVENLDPRSGVLETIEGLEGE